MKNLPVEGANSNVIVALYFAVKSLPVLVSAGAIYLGYRLLIMGVTGEASIVIDASGVGGQLLNAAPGAVFGVGGLAALVVSIFKGLDVEMNQNTSTADGGMRERRLVMNQRSDDTEE